MTGEVLDPPWFAMNFQIGRRGTDDHVLACNAARNHACLVVQFTGPNGEVVAILGEIGEAVAQRQVELQHRIPPRQLQQ